MPHSSESRSPAAAERLARALQKPSVEFWSVTSGFIKGFFSKVLARRSAHRSWPYAEDDRLCGVAYNGRVLDDLL